jgi:KUP system potassium uptake protein
VVAQSSRFRVGKGPREEAPHALLQLIRPSHILPQHAVIVNVRVMRVPRAPPDERLEVGSFGEGLYEVNMRYGFMQGFNIPSDLAFCVKRKELLINMEETTYYIGHTLVIAGRKEEAMMAWRGKLFSFMKNNTIHETSQFRFPADRVMEIGLQQGI